MKRIAQLWDRQTPMNDYTLYKYNAININWILMQGHLNYFESRLTKFNFFQCKHEKF